MIKLKDILLEALGNWKNQIWIHYTNTPYLKINPKQVHNDPTGIYLFPKEFAAKSDYWSVKKYAFYVKLKDDTNILDLGKITSNDGEQMLRKMVRDKKKIEPIIQKMKDAESGNDKFYKNAAYPFWEFLRDYFISKPVPWNKAFRDLEYDAIYDDSGSIHSMEHQILVLNPTKIKIIDMQIRKGSGYNDIILVADRIKDMMKDYKGYWIVEKPKKNMYGKLELFMMFSNLPKDEWKDDKYRDVSFRIYAQIRDNEKHIPPYIIYVSVSSTPRKPYGIGASYNIIDGKWDDVDGLKSEIDSILKWPTKYIS